jgi:hypothetical protein
MLKCETNCTRNCAAQSITPEQFSYTTHKGWLDTDSLCHCSEYRSGPQEWQQFSFIFSAVILVMIYRYTKLENLNRLDAGVLYSAQKPQLFGLQGQTMNLRSHSSRQPIRSEQFAIEYTKMDWDEAVSTHLFKKPHRLNVAGIYDQREKASELQTTGTTMARSGQ